MKELQKMVGIRLKTQRIFYLSNVIVTGSISCLEPNVLGNFRYSQMETNYAELLEFDKRVEFYYPLSFSIMYFKKDNHIIHIPCFYVEYWDNTNILGDMIDNKSVKSVDHDILTK